jgi:acetyl-CoA/propionyl-CoA carboxylase biotin carboxyl carrier protein
MFDSVLVANRGEIALRIMRACRELSLRTIAVYSEADRDAPHVRYADAAYYIGPAPAPQSYLNIDAILAAARDSGAGAIHPGYGFLSENASFAAACEAAGLVFVGPPSAAMQRMGGKVAARREALAAGVAVVPGMNEPVETASEVLALGEQFGFPLAIKADGGGGGRGFRVVAAAGEVPAALESARREALSGFGNPDVYIEKYLPDPRHIEIQVLADAHGQVVHLGERECSIQRRHQKLIEECPSPALTSELRAQMGAAAVALARAVGYRSAGTLEFMLQDGQFYFLEMNTRIQVEHTVTEMVTGVDLVRAQLRIARGERLWFTQDQVTWRGHAIECRINAEDASAGFRPAFGTVGAYAEPSGFGVRVDSGIRGDMAIPAHYDSMLAKLVTWGADRGEAIERMQRALGDYRIDGVVTTIPFHQLALGHPAFQSGDTTVNFIPRYLGGQLAALAQPAQDGAPAPDDADARMVMVEVNGRRFEVRVFGQPGASQAPSAGRRPVRSRTAHAAASSDDVVSMLHGTVTAVQVEPGAEVAAGQVLFVIEAMKMENEVKAPHAGTLERVHVRAGQPVESGMVLATYASAVS